MAKTLSKPSYHDLIVDTFKRHNWSITLGELLTDGLYTYGHSLTARLSELRQRGYSIKCERGPNPSQNLYIMTPPVNVAFDETGQGVMIV